MEYQALWQGAVLARSGSTIVVEGNQYFPPDSLRMEFFEVSGKHTFCPWKGIASYYTILVDGVINLDCAWSYRHPSFLVRQVKGFTAFSRSVQVEPAPSSK